MPGVQQPDLPEGTLLCNNVAIFAELERYMAAAKDAALEVLKTEPSISDTETNMREVSFVS